MPRAHALAWLAAAAMASAFAAYGADPPKPDLGAGPHLDRSESLGGEGKARRGSEQPMPPKPAASPSSGSSAETPEDANSQQLREEDEKKATRNKEKMKKRPGFKEDAPAPRAQAPR